MRLSSLFLLPLLAHFLSSSIAQGSVSRHALMQSAPLVRVHIGTFSQSKISGIDLRLNQSILIDGSSAFNLRCRQEKGKDWVEFGWQQKSEQKLDIEALSGFLTVNGKLYRNRVIVHSQNNQCQIVNHVDLEKYVSGLINKEMAPNWPLEALKAQSVAARTYALYQKAENFQKNYDVESTTLDQVYEGASSETPRSSRAVEETRGEILEWNKAPIKAFFHADCGGKTENPEPVWGKSYAYFKPVYCPYHPKKNWRLESSLPQVESALRKIGGLLPKNFRKLASLESGPLSESGRMNDVILSDKDGQSQVISANQLRNALGNTRFKSTRFEIQRKGNQLEFHGSGFGHGVGMCQLGARTMAEQGNDYRRILQYYYPLAKITLSIAN